MVSSSLSYVVQKQLMYVKKQTHNVDMKMLHLIVDNLGVDIFFTIF